jgi:hypothetical protein
LLWATFVALWFTGAASGLWVLWAYENRPGTAATAPARWPEQSDLAREEGRPTLILLVHPRCTCSAASLTEFAEILARAPKRPKAYVLFLKPHGVPDDWEKTDLWRRAAGLRDVTVVRDDDGLKAKMFGAVTSGQTFVYDGGGTLLFSGGITGARGHVGENAGRTAVLASLNRAAAVKNPRTGVFGCELFATDANRSATP